MAASKKDPIPKDFPTIDAAIAFWDRHSVADYAEHLKPANVRFRLRGRVHLLAVDPDIAVQLLAASRARGLSPETVANLWLRERLAKEPKRRRQSRRAA
jgi:erythromycin esterase-like protein